MNRFIQQLHVRTYILFFQTFPVNDDGRVDIEFAEFELPDEMVYEVQFSFTDEATGDPIDVPLVIETLGVVACNKPGMLCK